MLGLGHFYFALTAGNSAVGGGIVTDKVVIFVTAASRSECKKIARHLVETRLAACVNI